MKQIGKILEENDISNTLLFKSAQLDKWVREGYQILPNKILRDLAISAPALRIYLLLRARLFQKDYCYPGRERVASEVGLSVQQTDRYLLELKKAGYIEVKRRGQGKTNIYYIGGD